MKAENDAASRTKHGKNWTEANSLKLIDAYQYIQFVSMISITSSLLMPLDEDNVDIINDKIASKFTESSSDVKRHSTKAIKEC